MTDALLIVPPLLKMTGTLLGPSMLASAALDAGHQVKVVDLNAAFLEPHLAGCEWPRRFIGDHDRPSRALAAGHAAFEALSGGPLRGLDHRAALSRAEELCRSTFGDWVRARLPRKSVGLVGLSVMYEGQVIAALAISRIARHLYPSCLVTWGGAHVTALQHEVVRDARYGAWVDRFVFGYAEATWVELLRSVSSGGELPTSVVRAGSGRVVRADGDPRVTPRFEPSLPLGQRLTLPVQASRGCAYGRCAFCTYPSIEGQYRALDLGPALSVVEHASRIGAVVSFKDSLVVPERLLEIARRIAGRARWSACTKLHRRFDHAFLRQLAAGGCDTLEFGVETLEPAAQRMIEKTQSLELLEQVMDAGVSSGIGLVLNYITGFPGVDTGAEARALAEVQDALNRRPGLRAKLSLGQFELERLAPMAKDPSRFGIEVVGSWPWSSLLEWRKRASHVGAAPLS